MALIKAINPSKRTLSKGIKYISNPEKTEESLISGKDCDAQTALEEMKATKELYGKTGGRQYKHFIQSFKPDDSLDPSQAHQIGYEMAQKAFPGYEVLVATHTDKDHLHNHFIVNSVNFETGEKYRQSTNDLQEIKELSNRICEREGLHVMTTEEQTPGKALSMNEYQMAIKRESWKFTTMDDIDQTMVCTRSKEEFIKAMEDKGYQVLWTDKRKYITYTMPDGINKVRDNKLHDPKYLKEAMESGFRRIKEIELQTSQSGRSPDKQQNSSDLKTDILLGNRDGRSYPNHSERTSESVGISSQEIGTRREDQTGARGETPREREGRSGNEGKAYRNSQRHEERNQRNERNQFQKVGDDFHSGKRRSAKESGDLRQVHTADHRTSVSSEKYTKSELDGKDETVRSQSSDVSWDNSSIIGHVSGDDHTDEIIRTLGDPNEKADALAKREEVRHEHKTQIPKNHHHQEEERER